MSCCSPHLRIRPGLAVIGCLALASGCGFLPARYQTAAHYRVPVIAVAYPERGATLPADRAFIALRFAAGETDDPIDVTSFRATLDGVDQSAAFELSDTQAWGRFGPNAVTAAQTTAPTAAASAITPGTHTVAARICSVRGACASLTFVVAVQPWERALDSDRRAAPTN